MYGALGAPLTHFRQAVLHAGHTYSEFPPAAPFPQHSRNGRRCSASDPRTCSITDKGPCSRVNPSGREAFRVAGTEFQTLSHRWKNEKFSDR